MDQDKVSSRRLEISDFEKVFTWLIHNHYQVVGPVVKDGAVTLQSVSSFDEIARGCYDHQEAGLYRLEDKKDGSLFKHTVGPHSFKKFLYPPRRKLWEATKTDTGFRIHEEDGPVPRYAFFGVRSCDLEAIRTLDRVFMNGDYKNHWYEKVRQQLFILAAGCTRATGNCFCTTMGTGPEPLSGFDLRVVEVLRGQDHHFVTISGSAKGEEVIHDLGLVEASEKEIREGQLAIEEAIHSMPVRWDRQQVPELLKRNYENAHWDDVAERCLSCANCTMVCPTCFCSTTEDITDLTGEHSERWLLWDSCFNGEFSFVHGGKIRNSTQSRYRQWLTHKLSAWHDQYGTSGCVGCGRCITWCPVGIDLTREVEAIQTSEK